MDQATPDKATPSEGSFFIQKTLWGDQFDTHVVPVEPSEETLEVPQDPSVEQLELPLELPGKPKRTRKAPTGSAKELKPVLSQLSKLTKALEKQAKRGDKLKETDLKLRAKELALKEKEREDRLKAQEEAKLAAAAAAAIPKPSWVESLRTDLRGSLQSNYQVELKALISALTSVELTVAAGLTLGLIFVSGITRPQVGVGEQVSALLGTDFGATIEEGDEIGGYPVTSGFGPREAPDTNLGFGSSDHRGIDLGTPEGVKLYMIGEEGTVECADQPDGAGLYATITPKGIPFTFIAMHLRNCQSGTFRMGQVYAETGNTGNSSGPHLHWEQLKDGVHVEPQKGFLEATISGNWTDAMNQLDTAKVGFGDVTDRLMDTIITQESGGDHTAQNVDSGAAGKFQILPENIEPWAAECGIEAPSLDQFLADPQIQRAIAGCKIKQYWDDAKAKGVDDNTACRRVAAAWYSGNPDWYDYDGSEGNYPSIRDYTLQVCSRF